MAILLVLPFIFFFIVFERKKIIYQEYVLNKNIIIKKRYLILSIISYVLGFFVYFTYTSLISKSHDYSNLHLLIMMPLYIASVSVCLILYEYVLGFTLVFIEHIIVDKIVIKYYKLNAHDISTYNIESDEHPFKYYFYSNCVVINSCLVVSILIILTYSVFK